MAWFICAVALIFDGFRNPKTVYWLSSNSTNSNVDCSKRVASHWIYWHTPSRTFLHTLKGAFIHAVIDDLTVKLYSDTLPRKVRCFALKKTFNFLHQVQLGFKILQMTTSWKDVCARLKMQGFTGKSRNRGGSDESVTTNSDFETMTTNCSTPVLSGHNRSSFDNEWQMNYMIINRRDGL